MRRQWRWCAGAILVAAGLSSCHGGGATGPSDAGDTGGHAGTTADEVCRAAIRVQCERFAACGGLPLQQCLDSFFGPCPDYYFNAGSNYTVAGLSACIDVLAARTCTDLNVPIAPACLMVGKRPDGAPCAYDTECRSRACGGGTPCGVCQPRGVAALGAACDSGGCQPGAYCGGGGICIDGATVVHAGEGQPCGAYTIPAVLCTGDLRCAPPQSGSGAGACTAAPGAGQPCAVPGGICHTGTVCTDRMVGGTCVDPTTCGTGVACPPDSYCKAGDGGIACAPRAAVGEPCSEPLTPTPPPTLPPCVSPAVCIGPYPRAKCVLLRDVGEPCDDNNVCRGRLACANGRCPAQPSCPVDGGAE